ncbi:MAG TPA: hypothetical protein VK213_07755 [Bacteroidales bacterium]|nr:hypothetical protein [Bacteroidales bacterium]
MKKLFALLIIVSFIGIGSCKKKDKEPDYCTAGAWTTQINDELTVVMNTAVAYSSNPTTANCNAYKTAMQGYINALKPFENCTLWTAQDKTAFRNALQEAEQDLATACQ